MSQLKVAGKEIQTLTKAREELEKDAQLRVDEALAARDDALREGRQSMAVVAVQQRGLQKQARDALQPSSRIHGRARIAEGM